MAVPPATSHLVEHIAARLPGLVGVVLYDELAVRLLDGVGVRALLAAQRDVSLLPLLLEHEGLRQRKV